MQATMTDIANKVGVSQSAVSLVLNGKAGGRVSRKKSAIIRKAARELGFQVNLAAVGLRKQKSYVIGILSASPRDTYYGELMADFQHLISPTGYVASFGFWENQDDAKKVTASMLSRKIDALVTIQPDHLPDGLDFPVAALGVQDERYDSLSQDQKQSFQIRIDYLMELGHTTIDYLAPARDSRRGDFKNVIESRGLPYREAPFGSDLNYFPVEDWKREMTRWFDHLWDHQPRPTAIMAQNDVAAMLILRRAWERNIRVPDELSVIGFDDIPQAATCAPGLTTVNKYPKVAEAKLLLDVVFRRMENPDLPRWRRVSESELVVRESCAPPPNK